MAHWNVSPVTVHRIASVRLDLSAKERIRLDREYLRSEEIGAAVTVSTRIGAIDRSAKLWLLPSTGLPPAVRPDSTLPRAEADEIEHWCGNSGPIARQLDWLLEQRAAILRDNPAITWFSLESGRGLAHLACPSLSGGIILAYSPTLPNIAFYVGEPYAAGQSDSYENTAVAAIAKFRQKRIISEVDAAVIQRVFAAMVSFNRDAEAVRKTLAKIINDPPLTP